MRKKKGVREEKAKDEMWPKEEMRQMPFLMANSGKTQK